MEPRVRVQERDFSVDAVLDAVRSEQAGALVALVGTVRADPSVRGLDFSSYEEMALEKLAQLRAAAIQRFGLLDMAIVHRRGALKLGDNIVVIAAAAPHRKEALDACAWTMEGLKEIVPIWKAEVRG